MLALRKCQPCSALDFKDAGNVGFAKMSTLFCFGFQGCWEQDGRAWQYFLRKLLNQISVERLFFCKARQNSGFTAPLLQPLVAIGELQLDLRQHQKWLIKQKSLISTPVYTSIPTWNHSEITKFTSSSRWV